MKPAFARRSNKDTPALAAPFRVSKTGGVSARRKITTLNPTLQLKTGSKMPFLLGKFAFSASPHRGRQ
jgi:hypothetical protein